VPEIVWTGKYVDGVRVDSPVRPAALQPRSRFGAVPSRHRLLHGDNLGVLEALLDGESLRERVDLVYIDPPFGTGGRFQVATRVGSSRGGRPPPEIAAPAYSDRFEGGVDGFLAMLEPRLRRIHALLAPHGSFYVHVDPTVGHAVKLLCDEIFGPQSFQREIIWRIGWVSGFKTRARNWIRNHDTIFFYTKDPRRFTFHKHYVPYPEGYVRRDGSPPRGRGVPIDDVWNANETEFALRGKDSLDSIQIKSFSTEKSGYATQKNESLLRRIVGASSNPGDLVLDVFCGSGTTGVVAAELGRRFIGCDVNPVALHLATKRLLDVGPTPSVLIEEAVDGERRRAEPSPEDAGRPEPRFDVRPHPEGLAIELLDYRDPRPDGWPESLRAIDPGGLDLVDAWWVSVDPGDAPRAVHAWSHRSHRERGLATTLVVPPAESATVCITDVLHRTVEVPLPLR
jgi:adenine-specific DNA-methyltransferase